MGLLSKAAREAAKRLARRADLPMDEASRMQRARDMGFDVDTPLYRGLTRPYDAERAGHYQMFTTSPHEASDYAGDFTGANVVPAYVRRGRNASVDAGRANFNAIPVTSLPDDVRARLHPSIGATARTDEIAHAAKEAGYDSATIRNVFDQAWGERPSAAPTSKAPTIKDDLDALYRDLEGAGFDMGPSDGIGPTVSAPRPTGPVTVEAIFDPSNIRSRFAAFDPERSDESDLLAAWLLGAPAAGATGGGLLSALRKQEKA